MKKKQYKKPELKTQGNVEEITQCKRLGCGDAYFFGHRREVEVVS
jgi:hypothetical protein